MSKVIITLEFEEEEPTAQDVIKYINELGEELYFKVINKTEEEK